MEEPKKRPTMFMLAGPNGAGKSTLYETIIKPRIDAPFINSDRIQKYEMGDLSMQASYKAANIAEERRQACIKIRESFISESTFSHPSKLQLINNAKAAGFRVVLYHINVRSVNLSMARVASRVKEGGHNVPEEKIRARYQRNQILIKQAAVISDKAFVYDNSALNEPPVLVLSITNGHVERISKRVPAWTRKLYKNELKRFIEDTKILDNR